MISRHDLAQPLTTARCSLELALALPVGDADRAGLLDDALAALVRACNAILVPQGDAMAPATSSRKLTYADFEKIPDDGLRHEIIDGEHYVSPSPPTRHQRAVGNLYFLLTQYVRDHECGEVFLAPFDVVLGPHDILEPDIIYISHQRAHILTDANIQGAPDLVVEVLSDSTRQRDLTLKRSRYEALGVPEYWLIDPVAKTIQILRNQGGGYQEVTASPLFPGLDLAVTTLFPLK